MKKRGIVMLSVLTLLFMGLCGRIYFIGKGEYAEAANKNNSRSITITEQRANIYDCNMVPLTNTEEKYYASIVGGEDALSALDGILDRDELTSILPRLEKGFPVTIEVPNANAKGLGIQVVKTTGRYGKKMIAPHVVGYIDSEGNGVSGIEKAFNDYLKENMQKISISYTADAHGKILPGSEPAVKDETEGNQSGVMLTIDSKIQSVVAEAMSSSVQKGAAVVLEVETGKIRGMVSLPEYSPNDISASLSKPDSPLINRAISPYAVGSTFKLISAVAAMEGAYPTDHRTFVCTGSVQAGENIFSCVKKIEHGELTLKGALQVSCNCYFVNMSQKIGGEKILEVAKRFGFGQPISLADGIVADAGSLPEKKNLSSPAATANFSFGQGELSATPLQIASMTATIANEGQRCIPTLVEGLTDESGTIVSGKPEISTVMSMSPHHAKTLRAFMENVVENGTGKSAKPEAGGAGGKTGTAQTGRYRLGEEILNSWFTGYFPAENPKYAVAIMNEEGSSGSSDCAPIFKEIADALYELGYYS